MTGSARSRTVKITDADGQRLNAALEIRSHRCGEHPELIFIRRLYTDNRITAEHIRAHIQGCTAAVRRHISFICFNCLKHSFHKPLFRKNRHFKAHRTLFHSLCIQIRAEGNNASIRCSICLHTFKNCLRILQDACTFTDDHICILCHNPFIPCAILIIRYESVIRLDITKSKICPIDILLFHHTALPLKFLFIIILFTLKVNTSHISENDK
ncbi:hypothetical protein IMSAG117_01538 [Lactobacillaceae bacterium]|nr:hypothetical protein IMSAG117_01538 [Lactobacillaceae bacterium]